MLPRGDIFSKRTIGHTGSAAELRSDRKLVAGSYLGTAVDDAPVVAANGNGNGHKLDASLLETVSVRMPAKVKRALEQRAESEGRAAGAIVVDLLEKVNDR